MVRVEVRVEDLEAYWLSWFVLPNGPEEKLVLALLYLGLLFGHLDECVGNVVFFMTRYDFVTQVDSCFL